MAWFMLKPSKKEYYTFIYIVSIRNRYLCLITEQWMCDYRRAFKPVLDSGNTTHRKVFGILSYVSGASCSYLSCCRHQADSWNLFIRNFSNKRYPSNVLETTHLNRVDTNVMFCQLAELKYVIVLVSRGSYYSSCIRIVNTSDE